MASGLACEQRHDVKQEYGLCPTRDSRRSVVFVKLTESALKALEVFYASHQHRHQAPSVQLQLRHNHGSITVNDERTFNFSLAAVDGTGSFECIRHCGRGSRTVDNLGRMDTKLQVQGSDDSYQKTRVKMALASDEAKRHSAKVIKSTSAREPKGRQKTSKVIKTHGRSKLFSSIFNRVSQANTSNGHHVSMPTLSTQLSPSSASGGGYAKRSVSPLPPAIRVNGKDIPSTTGWPHVSSTTSSSNQPNRMSSTANNANAKQPTPPLPQPPNLLSANNGVPSPPEKRPPPTVSGASGSDGAKRQRTSGHNYDELISSWASQKSKSPDSGGHATRPSAPGTGSTVPGSSVPQSTTTSPPLASSSLLFDRAEYPEITDRSTRQRYKRDYAKDYQEYRELHQTLEDVARRFATLEESLRSTEEGSDEHSVTSYLIKVTATCV